MIIEALEVDSRATGIRTIRDVAVLFNDFTVGFRHSVSTQYSTGAPTLA